MASGLALLALPAAAPARAGAAAPLLASDPSAPRVACLDWTLASVCLSLGLVPAGVAELGLREAPSLEGLALLRPDLILINGFAEPLRPRLERIAPTLSLDVYGGGRSPLAEAEGALRALGRRFERAAEAECFLAGIDAGFARVRASLGAMRGAVPDAVQRRPVLPFNFADARTLRIYGAGSLYADALARIGLASAWPGATGPWGTATADLAAVASVPGAVLALVEPVPAEAEAVLSGGALWAGLTAGRSIVRLPAAWPFGEAGAALRFAELLAAALPAAEISRAEGVSG